METDEVNELIRKHMALSEVREQYTNEEIEKLIFAIETVVCFKHRQEKLLSKSKGWFCPFCNHG